MAFENWKLNRKVHKQEKKIAKKEELAQTTVRANDSMTNITNRTEKVKEKLNAEEWYSKHLDRAKVYDTKVLLGVSACFVISGLLLTTTYEVPILRYSFVGIILILLIVFHKKVINYVKKLISMRKDED